ncbi:copper chaperone CopZ [Vagococcus sp. BWB3-3]|uniref:Copper chaperone CopZ n=1 Tax=Vagococcus allomyrinae TaxID=2794353 RepID=A0A940PH16_9ENTE|nr:copper chaperone CopZ [Vagococcus allomyrinae]MBP1044477.1 copper chaperone CopZ [Vagococcus allomyrinae]
MKKEFSVTGMTCNHCVASVEKGVNELTGVEKVKVNLKKGRATVKYDETNVSSDQIVNKIKEVGYEAEVV